MERYIKTPTVGEIITEEFMKPLNISLETLASNTSLSETYLQAILNNEVKVTPETSMKLADYFGMSELFFYKLQKDIDKRNARLEAIGEVTTAHHKDLVFA